MTVNELRDFIFENYYKQNGFVKRLKRKDLLFLGTKFSGKIAHPSNPKKYYNSYLKRKI